MTEHCYSIGQKTGRAPVLKKSGVVAPGEEQTPFIWHGELLFAESACANDVCPVKHIRIRNYKTGELSAPFGLNFYFASAFAENETLHVFATSLFDDKPMTMYQSDDAADWHDPRGGHTVRMFTTRDLIHWEERDVLTCEDRRLWNTSVCRGEDGYMMAVEVSANPGEEKENPYIGNPFTCFFARSDDLIHWEMLPDETAYTPRRYNACPALRYADGYYYMICLEELPCVRYAPYIYRTKNFMDWEVGFHNPIMMFSDEDRVIKPGFTFTEEEKKLLETGLNINNSDLDLCEFEGKTKVFYCTGDQMTYSFLGEAEYDGPMDEFLKSFFQ